MSQRDTLLPVCKLVSIANATTSSIPLTRTAQSLASVTATDLSGLVTDTPVTFTVSSTGPAGTSATFTVEKVKTSTTETKNVIKITEPGVYNGGHTGLGVSGMGAAASMNSLGASGNFTPVLTNSTGVVPYITVTDLSGTDGYFRVAAPSSNTFYTSGSATTVEDPAINVDSSGFAGVIAAPGTTAVLTLQPSQAISEVLIENQLALEAKFAINYGVIKEASPLRDQDFPEVL